MADAYHIEELLSRDAAHWNEWRKNWNFTPHLSGADLANRNLADRDLSGASLGYANLRGANLANTDLDGSTLMGANFENANLRGASLQSAVMTNANFFRANLMGANLRGATLTDSDLRTACLVEVNLSEATITGVRLYGSANDGWKIGGVRCDFVYWDAGAEQRTPDRRDFAQHEFERLYQCLPIVEYFFQRAISPIDLLIMDRVVQAIRERNPEFDMKIDSINARGLAPSVKFTVRQEEQKDRAYGIVVAEYESRLQRMEAEKDRLYDLLGRAIDKTGIRLIEAGPGAIVATENARVNIEQHITQAVELQKAVAAQPEDSETFRQVAKRKVMDVIGGAIQDFAKGKVREAALEIVDVCKDLGPIIVNTTAYAFFKAIIG